MERYSLLIRFAAIFSKIISIRVDMSSYYFRFRARHTVPRCSRGDCPKRDGETTSQGKEPVTHGEGRRGFRHDGWGWFQRGFRGGVR